MTSKWRHRLTSQNAALVLMMLTGAAMVGSLLVRHPHVSGDSLRYLFPIYNLIEGNGYTYRGTPELLYPPGLGLLSYPVARIVGDVALSGALVSALCYLLLIPTAYHVAKLLFDERAGVLAALFATVSPWVLRYSYEGLTDVPYTLFYLIALGLFARLLASPESLRQYLWLGFVLGIEYLIRPEAAVTGTLVIVSLIFCVLIRKWRSSGLPGNRISLLYPVATAIIFFVLILPYLLFMRDHVGRWTLSAKTTLNLVIGEKVVEGGMEHIDRLVVDRPEYWDISYQVDVVDYIRSRGAKFGERIRRNVVEEGRFLLRSSLHSLVPLILFSGLALVGGGGLPRTWQALGRPAKVVPFFVFFAPLALLPVFYLRLRHLLPYAMLIHILAAGGISVIIGKNKFLAARGWLRWTGVVAGAISVVVASGAVTRDVSLYGILTSGPSPGLAAVQAAGRWLGSQTDNADDLVVAGVGGGCGDMIMYHAGGDGMPSGTFIPITLDITLDEAAGWVRSGRASYLVLTRECGRPYTEEIVRLWEKPESAGELGLVLVQGDEAGSFQVYAKESLGWRVGLE